MSFQLVSLTLLAAIAILTDLAAVSDDLQRSSIEAVWLDKDEGLEANRTAENDDSFRTKIEREDDPWLSACLIVKDDNQILPEWLAYHYETGSLRRLIVAVDQYSVTSPLHIFYSYRSLINITHWTNEDYMHTTRRNPRKYNYSPNASDDEKHKLFIHRQSIFYNHCVHTLRKEGQRWTFFLDSDEFLSFNSQNIDAVNNTKRENESLEWLMQNHNLSFEGKTIAQFLHENEKVLDLVLGNVSHCMYLPRFMNGARERMPNDRAGVSAMIQGFDIQYFWTVRFPYHDDLRSQWRMGKTIADISRIPPHAAKINNPHLVFQKNCHLDVERAFFRVHHYTGSLEEFLSRPGDPTRSVRSFEYKNSFQIQYRSDDMGLWLSSFARRVGREVAFNLTQGLREEATRMDTGGASRTK